MYPLSKHQGGMHLPLYVGKGSQGRQASGYLIREDRYSLRRDVAICLHTLRQDDKHQPSRLEATAKEITHTGEGYVDTNTSLRD